MIATSKRALKFGWRTLQYGMRQKYIRQLMYAGILLLSFLFIGYAVYKNWNQIKAQQWNFNYPFIILPALLYPLGMLPTVAAWHHLLRAFEVNKPFKTNLRLYALSILPKHIPGFVVFITSRTLLYQEEGVPAAITVAATGAETALLGLTGFIASISLILFGGKQLGQLDSIRRISPIAIVVLILLVLTLPWMKQIVQRVLIRFKVKNAPQLVNKELSLSLVWMFLAWCGGGFLLYLLALAISPLPLDRLPLIIGMWSAASAVSLTIGIGVQGLGLREVTLGALLSLILPPLAAIVLSVAFRILLTVDEVFWVWIFVGVTRSNAIKKEKTPKILRKTE